MDGRSVIPMSANSRNHNPVKDFRRVVPSKEIVLERMLNLGFNLESKDFSFGQSNLKSKVDFIFRRGRRKFAVKVKYSRKMQLVLMHLLPRGILLLQAARRVSGFVPMVAIVVEKLGPKDITRMADHMNFYAPEVGWLMLDEYGNGAFRDPDRQQSKILPQSSSFVLSPKPESYSLAPYSKLLSFSDLDQWLLKVFLLSHPVISADFWGGPRGIVENAFQLSKLAGVSPPVANSWVNAMEGSGYLKRVGRKKLILLRSRAILEEWRGKYRFGDHRILPYRSIYPVSDSDKFLEEILAKIKSSRKNMVPLAISGHQACRLLGVKHSTAKSIHIYSWGNIHFVAGLLDLVPAEAANEADLFLVESKYPKSVFGGRVIKEGIPVCDLLQIYLDLFNLPDRGREQADFVYQNILSQIFSERPKE